MVREHKPGMPVDFDIAIHEPFKGLFIIIVVPSFDQTFRSSYPGVNICFSCSNMTVPLNFMYSPTLSINLHVFWANRQDTGCENWPCYSFLQKCFGGKMATRFFIHECHQATLFQHSQIVMTTAQPQLKCPDWGSCCSWAVPEYWQSLLIQCWKSWRFV